MRDNCNDCKAWEEKIYWTHFQSVHFFLILSGHHQLALPKKFVKKFGEKLGEDVSLKVPSGAAWNVGLVEDRGSLSFKLGWKEFIDENSLEEGDILIFKYDGGSGFDVLLFDSQSLCEKEGSYFIKKCDHTADTPRNARRKETWGRIPRGQHLSSEGILDQDEESFQVRSQSSDDFTDWTPSKRSRKDHTEILNSGRQRRANRRTHREINNLQDLTPEVHGTPEACGRRFEFISNRRPITEEEKNSAEQMANRYLPDDGLVIVMKEYQVYRDFFLTIPAWWLHEHLPPKNMLVYLQVEEERWAIKLMKRSSGGMLTTGWKKFALENGLEEFDACIFKLVSGSSGPAIIDVKIYRVVDEVVPPTPIHPGSSSRRGRRKPQKQSARQGVVTPKWE